MSGRIVVYYDSMTGNVERFIKKISNIVILNLLK